MAEGGGAHRPFSQFLGDTRDRSSPVGALKCANNRSASAFHLRMPLFRPTNSIHPSSPLPHFFPPSLGEGKDPFLFFSLSLSLSLSLSFPLPRAGRSPGERVRSFRTRGAGALRLVFGLQPLIHFRLGRGGGTFLRCFARCFCREGRLDPETGSRDALRYVASRITVGDTRDVLCF